MNQPEQAQPGYWWCPECESEVEEFCLYNANHDKCGWPVQWVSQPEAGEDGHACVFCGEVCQPAPTKRGWTRIDFQKGLHFDCAQKVVDNGKSINREAGEEKRFTLAEALEIWGAGYQRCWDMTATPQPSPMFPNQIQYFKEKFNIDL